MKVLQSANVGVVFPQRRLAALLCWSIWPLWKRNAGDSTINEAESNWKTERQKDKKKT